MTKMEEQWIEFLSELKSCSIFCLGYAGFANSVPRPNQLLNSLIQKYAPSMFNILCTEIQICIETINNVLVAIGKMEDESKVESAADEALTALKASLRLESIKLAYLSLGLQKYYFESRHNDINQEKVKEALHDICSLPVDYLDNYTVMSINGCFLNSCSMKELLRLSIILENTVVGEWLDEKEIEVLKYLKIVESDEDLYVMTLYDFLQHFPRHLTEDMQVIAADSPKDINQSIESIMNSNNLLWKVVK